MVIFDEIRFRLGEPNDIVAQLSELLAVRQKSSSCTISAFRILQRTMLEGQAQRLTRFSDLVDCAD